MDKTKTGWIFCGFAVFETLFLVFCLSFIVEARFDTRMTKSELQARENGVPMSLAPQNLATAPESLRLDLRVELQGFPTEEMTKTKAWSKLQNTASEYARRLQFVEQQNRLWEDRASKRSLWLVLLYLASAIGVIVFGSLNRRNGGAETTKGTEAQRTETSPT